MVTSSAAKHDNACRLRRLAIEALIERLYQAVAAHAKELDDDVTLLAFRYRG